MQRMMVAPRPLVAMMEISRLIDDGPIQALDESGFIDRTYSSYGVA